MNKKTANKKYDLNKGKIIGALRALGLSEKAKPPKEWVGESHNPDSLQYQKFRKGAKNLLKKFTDSKQEAGK